MQLAKGLKGITEEQLSEVVIAYEPVWAIGTGLTATPEIAEDVHKYIRSWFAKTYSAEAAEAMRIQYGGSVTPETVDELMAQPDIDGALVSVCLFDEEARRHDSGAVGGWSFVVACTSPHVGECRHAHDDKTFLSFLNPFGQPS